MDQRVIIIAGPNGAGKSTFAREFLPHEAQCPVFVDADLIAAGLSPFDPALAAWRAGRVMLEEIEAHVRRAESFAFETTLAGRIYAHLIPAWQKSGYKVHLVFLRLESVELAMERVKVRVAQGGHNVPQDVIRRRFGQGQHNFSELYRPLVDSWQLYDNSGETPLLVDAGTSNL